MPQGVNLKDNNIATMCRIGPPRMLMGAPTQKKAINSHTKLSTDTHYNQMTGSYRNITPIRGKVDSLTSLQEED